MINLCWYVGAVWNDKDMTDKFVSKGYWENGWDDKFTDIVNQIKVGDKIAIKSSYTQKNNLPFDIKGETASVMAIKYTGTVTKIYHNGKRVDVDWNKEYEQKTWFFFTGRTTIWKVERNPDDWMYGALLDFTFNNTEQKYDAFLAHPYWANKYSTADQKYGENEMTNDTVKQYADLLKSTHNLILHGAPGTGKTHLAYEIAEAMQAEVDFVQFHPSYDYTDFVEGLRPVNDGNGQIGFERKDGVFKKFCERALKKSKIDDSDNFSEIWDKLINELNENNFVNVPLLSGRDTMRVELNEYGDGLANRTYENDDYVKGNGIRGQSKFFTKEQCYNIYKGLPGIPSGGHDNYRKAIVKYMKDKMGLVEYKEGTVTANVRPFVFIIDEINRGEMSKIFGELFFAIEPSYRGAEKCKDLRTQYANLQTSPNLFDVALGIKDSDNFGHFFIPENVYIIGTMNDIDRNVESMDFAFRRRFTFKEITAKDTQEQILSGLDDSIRGEAVKRMDSLNEAISKIEGLSSSYHIGGAYFLKLKDLDNDFGKLWEYHLAGLLREYLRGMENAKDELDKLRMAYDLENSASQQG